MGPGRLLRRAIQADQLSSLIFYGPPGTGKTTLAMVISNMTKSHFITINAVLAGVKEIREAISDAQERRNLYNQRTTLFVDEVHRWNKAQQDALLPHVERGTIILIGATTENPYFEVNKALVSRSRIFQLKPLTGEDLRAIAAQALADSERGFGTKIVEIDQNALDHLINVANGDARSLLNALELAVETTDPGGDEVIRIDLSVAEESIQQRAVLYDKDGDAHYDTISAFIKSLRGSDPDAALYWMAKMVYAGEDPRFIFRRMAIFASEDVGLADPHAVVIVKSCWELFERIGMPEGRFPLGQAAIYLATAPKSNSVFAFFDALKVLEAEKEAEVPNHLRDANRDSKGFGHGKGYLYPHAFDQHWVAQQYLPSGLQGRLFYQPTDIGYEKDIGDEVARKRELQLAAMLEQEGRGKFEPEEILTYSPPNRQVDRWLQRAVSQSSSSLEQIRDALIETSRLRRHHLVLIINEKSGLMTWEAMRQTPEGGVWAIAAGPDIHDMLVQQAAQLPELSRPQIVKDWTELPENIRFDVILFYEHFLRRVEPHTPLFEKAAGLLRPTGHIIVGQRIPREGQRLSAIVEDSLTREVYQGLRAAEDEIFSQPDNPLVNWEASTITKDIEDSGLALKSYITLDVLESRLLDGETIEKWFRHDASLSDLTIGSALRGQSVSEEKISELVNLFKKRLINQPVPWRIRFGIWDAG